MIVCHFFQGRVAAPSLNPDAEVWTNPGFSLNVPCPTFQDLQQPWAQFSDYHDLSGTPEAEFIKLTLSLSCPDFNIRYC